MSNVEGKSVATRRLRRPLWARSLCAWADRIVAGQLAIRFPDGSAHHAQGALPGPSAIIHVRSGRLVWKLATGGSLGFARAYIDGDWDSPDLGAVLQLGLANEAALAAVLNAPGLARLVAFLKHRLRANTRAGSRRNIAFHYDLGNDFYRLWLDETMTYSSAMFHRDDLTLAEAQRAKYARIVEALELGPKDHVLEIGCGWGGFAEYAATEAGCRITALTLSREQAGFARERLAAAGLSDRVEIRLQDYRDCVGRFDKIVSIEMFEAVGEENWPTYFDALRALLKPGGRAMVQSITIAEERFDNYRRNADFIQTYIFPGGMLPSPTAFAAAATERGLKVLERKFFGADYERTLLAWDRAFVAAWHRIEALGFDARFKRMWRYYLHYCATGFRHGTIDVCQFQLAPEG
ncbi:SAM-dependent methyltransferase [Mycoplana dimorpha]|uniref:Cyclopropane-fatty-acyl-phospholipid synthase n=1 Tax=Mycoplana dimorpha TaxID=28320 RepID=A0A2T5BF31_MYCDI|nr:cyclopropane-fatty-acyl-phospholipid synthase family protein [Mycoplana dimorpha]PTM97597.1 cyclopropane-fatty-acyl-phospholipid synthase [Mycoplana dimorpha]